MNAKEFYNKIVLDENANIKTVVVAQTGTVTKSTSKYDFFNRIQLDINNNLKIIFE